MPDITARATRFSAKVLEAYARHTLPEGLTVRASTDAAPAEILLYDEIGFWGVTAKDFALALTDAGAGPLRVRINSPGGDVFDGLAIHNALKARGNVEVVVDGLAASAASFIAMAGSKITMASNAFLMIHNAWGVVAGNRHDLAETEKVLAKIDGQLAGIYAARSGKPVEEMAAAMDGETWFTSSEAKAAGLVDHVEGMEPASTPENKGGGGLKAAAPEIERRRRLARWASAA
ncbi:head maturation protease, ClpP-related [Roseomonas sp. USHLN139]|uniref:head maturation protease, ClpP-related n=1 Tax=Roseomonas sp. USHLN139 TaxID=3081298 RepID=UPI003B022B2E